MFKNIFYFFRQYFFHFARSRSLLLVTLVFPLLVSGCQIFPKLPPVDLSQKGWNTMQGEVIWRAQAGAAEIAGELLLATNRDGRTFVQFTKTPLPFIAAQTTGHEWQLQSIPNNKTYSGPGQPPIRVIWLWLPWCLQGKAPPKKLFWERRENNGWHLENRKSGEYLEGYLSP